MRGQLPAAGGSAHSSQGPCTHPVCSSPAWELQAQGQGQVPKGKQPTAPPPSLLATPAWGSKEPHEHFRSCVVTPIHYLLTLPGLPSQEVVPPTQQLTWRAAAGSTSGLGSFSFTITHMYPFIKQSVLLHSQIGVFPCSKQPSMGLWFTFIFTGRTRQLLF